MMPRILITGASGFLGGTLCGQARERDYQVWGTFYKNRPADSAGIQLESLDLKSDSQVAELVRRILPEVVIHTAYSQNESEVTCHGTRRLAEACASMAANPYFVFVSTDLVFDGKKGLYREDDRAEPVLDYGRDKLAAEQVVRTTLPGSLVVRTSLLYDLARIPGHLDFALKAIRKGHSCAFFRDEYRSPTLVHELASALLDLARLRPEGLLHIAGRERMDRFSFGSALLAALGFSTELVAAGSLQEYAGNRPADCSLDSSIAEGLLKCAFRGASSVLEA